MLQEAWKWVHLYPPLPNSCNAMTGHGQKIIAVQRQLCDAVDSLAFAPPVTHVYNPLRYAQRPAETYLQRYLSRPEPEALFLGMNPGPWGMAQSGVPFGDVTLVRDWMAIDIDVDRPPNEHSKKPVCGAACHRREVSGRRFWGWAKSRFRTPEAFFSCFGVLNYCPLCFLDAEGRNYTPNRLPTAERTALFEECDAALAACCEVLDPALVIGIGNFARDRAEAALPKSVRVGKILHPSPANPQANRSWAPVIEGQLAALGVAL